LSITIVYPFYFQLLTSLYALALGDYALVLDPNGRDGLTIVDANEAACVVHGYLREELIGKSIITLDVGGLNREVVESLVQRVSAGEMLRFETAHRRKDGSTFPVEVLAKAVHLGGKGTLIFSTERDITERKTIEDAQAFLLQCGLPATGEDFFESLARYLAETLDMEYVCIDRLEGDGLTAQTVAIYNDGQFESNVRYALKDTPCGDVVGKSVCCYPRGVKSLFPKDAALQELNAESYFGTTLVDSKGQIIGLIAIIGHRALDDPKRPEALLRLVAPRAAGELERRRAKEALRESEVRYRTLVQASSDVVYHMKPDWTEMRQLQGRGFLADTSAPDRGWLGKYIHPEDQTRVLAVINEAIRTKSVFELEHRVLRVDGSLGWTFSRAIPILEERGEIIEWFGAASDITLRKQAEEALRERDAQYRTILHTAMDGFLLVDMEGRFLAVNEAYCRLSGYDQESLLKMCIHDLELLETSADTLAHVEKIRTLGQDRFETKHRRKDGSTYEAEVSVQYRSEGGGQMYAFIRDITAKKQAEAALLESEKRFLAFMHHLPAAAFIKDSDGRTLFANQYLADLFGFKNWECKTTTELVGGAIGQQMVDSDRKAFEQGPLKLEETISDFQGVGRTFETIKFPIFMQGKPALLGGISRDITERKQAEEKLQESEGRFRSYFEVPLIGIAITSLEKGWLEINDCLCDMLAYSRAELMEKTWAELTHPEDLAADVSQFNRVLDGSIDGYCLDKRFLRKDGQILWVCMAVRCVRKANGSARYFVATLQDLTERKKLEVQLLHSRKQEAIGQLAGGVAHDFNNILAAMMMNIGSLEQNPKLDTETQESLKELLAEAERAASLVRQLLLFSRKSVMEKKVLDLNEVVANLLKMLGRLIGEHVCLRFERANGLPVVEADQGMIEQVLMNLAVNARDAMPNGGRLVISLKIVSIGEGGIKGQVDVSPGPFVCLVVQDTGCGIDKANQNKIFEPFFTTKEVGKGTGLGLATVYGIAALHKGWVEVESEVGQGTTFRIYLPQWMQGISEPDQTLKSELFRGGVNLFL
jgi:PAS domain S-box-containing protein